MNPGKYSFDDYENPPVMEEALSVQFEPLRALKTPHFGLLWQEYKHLNMIEDHAPLEQAFELFEGERLVPHLEIGDLPPLRRCWFKNDQGTKLVQIQSDRFAHNWRRLTMDDPYPKYPEIREDFIKDFQVFQNFVSKKLGQTLACNQCEITYVNPIPVEPDFQSFGQLHEVLTILTNEYSSDFLREPEDTNIAVRYIFRDEDQKPVGRLHVNVMPVRDPAGKAHFLLRLTSRGKPMGEGEKGIMDFMDAGHKWIVRGFTSITTGKMHEKWGKIR